MGTLNSAEIATNFNFNYSGGGVVGPANITSKLAKILQFSNGVGAGQANILYAAERPFLASTADVIDLSGVLKDAFGDTIVSAEIVSIVIIGQSAAGVDTTTTLTVGAGANPWSTMFGAAGNSIKVNPGGVFLNAAPDANGLGTVTPGTGDILTVTPGAAAGSYLIGILARTA